MQEQVDEETQWSRRFAKTLEYETNDYSDEEYAMEPKSIEYKVRPNQTNPF